MEIQVLIGTVSTNVAGFNRLIGSKPSTVSMNDKDGKDTAVQNKNVNYLRQKLYRTYIDCVLVCFMVFNATFNNISVISWRSALLVEETGGP